MKKILVATDFSHASAQALKNAIEIATACSARILLLHIVHDPAEAPCFYAAKKAGKKVLRNIEQAAEQMMNDFVAQELGSFDQFDTHVVPGLPSEQIVRWAKKEKVDLIAIGSHGRSGLVRLILGSVADSVIRTAHCTILTVHKPSKNN